MGSYGKDFLTFWAIKSLIFELGSKFLDLPPHFRPQGWLYKQDRYQKFNIEPSRGILGNLAIFPIGKPYKSILRVNHLKIFTDFKKILEVCLNGPNATFCMLRKKSVTFFYFAAIWYALL